MTRVWVLSAAISGICAVSILATTNWYAARDPGAPSSAQNRDVTTVHIGGYRLDLSPEEATIESDLVIRGIVRSVGGHRWNTPDGAKPAGWSPGQPLRGHLIYGTAMVQVEEVLAGSAPEGVVRVTTVGGKLDGLEVASSLGPPLRAGQEVVLFLVSPGDPQKTFAPENYTAVQTFEVAGDLATSEGQESLSLEEVKVRVASVVKPD
jgi:hypothetical protein